MINFGWEEQEGRWVAEFDAVVLRGRSDQWAVISDQRTLRYLEEELIDE
jgi:hypothetical protein